MEALDESTVCPRTENERRTARFPALIRNRSPAEVTGGLRRSSGVSTQPDLSVIVVTHNGLDMAVETLRSARAATGKISAEWLVVDSGSTDGTPDALLSLWPDLRLERRANIGFAAGNNVALSQATGRYVLLLNPDVEVRDGTFEDLVAELDRRPTVGAASVVQLTPDGRPQPSARRFSSPLRELATALLLPRLPIARGLGEEVRIPDHGMSDRSVDWVVGAFLVVRQEALAQVGPLDDRFFLYSEEEDWCMRIRAAGWDIRHLPTLRVVHHCGGYGSPALAAQLTYSKLLLARKHFDRPRRVAHRLALVLRHGLRLVLRLLAAPFSSTARARLRHEAAALRVAIGASGAPFAS